MLDTHGDDDHYRSDECELHEVVCSTRNAKHWRHNNAVQHVDLSGCGFVLFQNNPEHAHPARFKTRGTVREYHRCRPFREDGTSHGGNILEG